MMSMTDVPNGNISFLKGVRQVVLTPLLCQLTHLSSFVLPAQRRTEVFILLLIIFDYTSIRRMETESPCSPKKYGFVWRVETESPQISKRIDVLWRVGTDSSREREGLLMFSVLWCLLFSNMNVTFFNRKQILHSSFSHPNGDSRISNRCNMAYYF